MHYRRWKKHGDPLVVSYWRIDGSVADRFWPRVNMAGPLPTYAPHLGRCWLWRGKHLPAGYAQFTINRKPVYAHRVVFELSGRTIPEGLHVDHLCRVKGCINPFHLEPVTKQENDRRRDIALGVGQRRAA
jgi:hypothetical protein